MAERPDGPNSGWGSESFCLSVHLSCLVTSLYLSASVCLILLVCLPSASQRVYLFSYLVFLSIFYRGIHSSFNQFCFIYLSVHLHISAPIHPSIQLFIFCIRLFHLPYLPSRKDIYIYIYLFIYPLKRTMCLAISPRVSLSLCLEMLKHTTFCGNQTQAQCSRHLFVPRDLSQMSHEVNRMKIYHWQLKCIYG